MRAARAMAAVAPGVLGTDRPAAAMVAFLALRSAVHREGRRRAVVHQATARHRVRAALRDMAARTRPRAALRSLAALLLVTEGRECRATEHRREDRSAAAQWVADPSGQVDRQGNEMGLSKLTPGHIAII